MGARELRGRAQRQHVKPEYIIPSGRRLDAKDPAAARKGHTTSAIRISPSLPPSLPPPASASGSPMVIPRALPPFPEAPVGLEPEAARIMND